MDNALLDVSALSGGFALGSGQLLSGNGAVVGNVIAGPGAGLSPGNSAATLTFSNNLTLNNSANVFELNADPTQIGSNVNDLVSVTGTLTLTGVNTLKIVPLASLSTTAPYTLFQYGALVGDLSNLNVVSDSRYSFTPSLNSATTPPSLQVQVAGSGAAATLVWHGGAANPNLWDTKATANWLNSSSPDVFYLGDSVIFDDTATTGTVTLSGTLQPASITLNNSALSYTMGGSGSLLAGGLTVNSGQFSLANSAANSFAAASAINGGTLRLANSGGNTFFQPLQVNGGTLVFDPPTDSVFSGVLADNGASSGLVEKRGPNTLTLSGNNTNFNGSILVSEGILKVGHTYALGSTNLGTTVANGAALDLAGMSLYNPGEVVTISGSGPGGIGAILNSGGTQNNALLGIILSSNAAISAWTNRWDVRGPGGSGSFSGLVNLGGFTLTKLGPGQNSLVDADITSDGSIDIMGGLLSLTRCNIGGAGIINLRSNILFLENYSAGYLNKPLVSSGGTLRCNANFSLGVTITNLSGLTLDTSATLTHQVGISGTGPLTKIGTGTNLFVCFDPPWSGNATISAGALQIGSPTLGDSTLPDLPLVDNASLLLCNTYNAMTNTHEISGTGSITKYGDAALTLAASNSFTGSFTASSGSPSPAGTSGGIIRLLHSSGFGTSPTTKNVTLVRTEVQLVGPLDIPTNITLRTSANSGVTGAGGGYVALRNVSGNNLIEGQIILTSGAGNSEFCVDAGQLTFNGGISPDTTSRVLILPVSTTPTSVGYGVSGGNLTLSWPADHIGWRLLVQTNRLSLGVSSNLLDWSTVPGSTATNQVTLPVDAANPTEFYRLVYP